MNKVENTLSARPSKGLLIFAYLMLYLVWGSTYLAIKFSIETIPPLLSGAIRFLTAGALLLAVRMLQTGYRTTSCGWKHAFVAGLLPFAVTYGIITTAETVVPSSIAALLISIEPLWFCLIGWLVFKGAKPARRHYIGIIAGFSGVFFLVAGDPKADFSLKSEYLFWIIMILFCSLSWVVGAFISKNPKIHKDAFMSSGMQMLCGGTVMLLSQYAVSAFNGSYPHIGSFSFLSAASLIYLIIFGSWVGYTSFLWLMRVEPANRVSTHAFVNPIVAVFLGWLIGGEELHTSLLAAAPLIIISVILMVWEPSKVK